MNIVYIGSGTDGWLGIVHGGVLATLMDESLGRVAALTFPARTGVTANLNVNYRAPVDANDFYVVHTQLDPERSTDRKAFVQGQLRGLTGKVYVEAEALFVVPKKFSLGSMENKF